jgi:hypothetical protein
MCSQNAANVISGIQILKIFRGDAPKPPSKISQSFRHWAQWKVLQIVFLKLYVMCRCKKGYNTKRCSCKKATRPDLGGNIGIGGKKFGGGTAV